MANVREYLANKQIFRVASMVDRDIMPVSKSERVGVGMADKSAIEWTDATWNPVTGCTKISPGCDNCYAARFSERFRGVPGHPFETGFDLTLRPQRLLQPFEWKKPRMIFVNSMSDLFHKDIPAAYIGKVFETMEGADWHIYQILTKRSSLLQKFVNQRYSVRPAPAHMWFGVSVENERATSRIAHLQEANACIRFLSIEPLIAPVGKLNLKGISWVIVGGGKRATCAADGRKMGDRYSQSMRAGEGGILLQAMGWKEFEGRWQVAGRRRVESVSYGVSDLRGLA